MSLDAAMPAASVVMKARRLVFMAAHYNAPAARCSAGGFRLWPEEWRLAIGDSRDGAIADARVLRRLRNKACVESRIRRIECVDGAIDGIPEIVDLSMNVRSADAGGIRDVELV